MKIAQFAVIALLGLLCAKQGAAAPSQPELDDLSIVTATPRDPTVKPVPETAAKEIRRPETPPPEKAKGDHRT